MWKEIRKMKKIIAVLIILLSLTACTAPAQFKPNDPANSESINNFLAQEKSAYAAGKHFQVKLLPVYKVRSGYLNYYCYQLLIAPLTDEKLDISLVSVSADDRLDEFHRYQSSLYGLSEGIRRELIHDIPLMEEKEKHWAIRSDFIFYCSQEAQNKLEIVDEQMDDYLKTLKVTIKYNIIHSETITVTSDHEVATVTADDEIVKQRKDLYALVNCGEMVSVCSTAFSGYGYPITAAINQFHRPDLFGWAAGKVSELLKHHGNLMISESSHFGIHSVSQDGETSWNATRNEMYLIYSDDSLCGFLLDFGESDRLLIFDEQINRKINELMNSNKFYSLIDAGDGMLAIWTFDGMIVLNEGTTEHYWDEFRQFFPQSEEQIDEKEKKVIWDWSRPHYQLETDGE